MNKFETMGDFFDKISGEYDTHMEANVEAFEEFYLKVAAAISETQEAISILDIGCGTGLELAAVFKKAPNALITGIDLSVEMLNILNDKYAAYGGQITLLQESYLTYPFDEKTYDYIISAMTAHHLLPESKREMYRKIRKALKSGGQYIEGDYITTLEKEKEVRESFFEIQKSKRWLVDGTHHIDLECSLETQKRLLAEAGFTRVEVLWERGETAVYRASI
jgi:tRNA (cmo5U34)-methyltransferase